MLAGFGTLAIDESTSLYRIWYSLGQGDFVVRPVTALKPFSIQKFSVEVIHIRPLFLAGSRDAIGKVPMHFRRPTDRGGGVEIQFRCDVDLPV
jgi:hypothetical protein